MTLKEEMEDLRLLAKSNWATCGVALQVVAAIVIAFFAADIKWHGGRVFYALSSTRVMHGSALDLGRYLLLFLAVSGGVCSVIGCARVMRQRNDSSGKSSKQ